MIGVFDSGLGGLTVLKEFIRELPNYDYIYLGDTARVPYGNRSSDLVYEFSRQACDYLFEQGCELIIIACNTASGLALRKLQQEYIPAKNSEKKILGVIRPVSEFFAGKKCQRIGLIGTRGTVKSNVYKDELKNLDSKTKVIGIATPLLVPLIEENRINQPETKKILREYLRPLKLKKVESLILGCTHYPLLIKQIRQVMGKQVEVPNPAEIAAKSLADYLKRHQDIEKLLSKNKKRIYLVTDLTENFEKMAERFLGEKIKINSIDI